MQQKNKTAQASILCQSKWFQVWLNDQIKYKTGIRVTCKDQAREAVRAWCEIGSLGDLNKDSAAVARFNKLVALFGYEGG